METHLPWVFAVEWEGWCTVSMGCCTSVEFMDNTCGAAARASLLLTIPFEGTSIPCSVGDTEAQSCRGARPVGVSAVTQRPASWSSPPWAVTPMLSWGCWVDHLVQKEVAV